MSLTPNRTRLTSLQEHGASGPTGALVAAASDEGYESPDFDFVSSGSDSEEEYNARPSKKHKQERKPESHKVQGSDVGGSLEDEEALALKLLGQ